MFPIILWLLAGQTIFDLKGELMSTLNLYKQEINAKDGTSVRLVYDQEADILEIFFGKNEAATGIELNEHILLRLNQQTKRAISLLLNDFSILTERTEFGPRSFPLDGLEHLPTELRDLVLQLIVSMPVSQFLKVSHFHASPTERVPLTYVASRSALAVA